MSLKKLVRLIAPLVLVVSMLLGLTSVTSALAVYNKSSEHELYVRFVPDQCTGWSFVPGEFCTELVTINPNSSWSSNNRAGKVTLGWPSDLIGRVHPRGQFLAPTGVQKSFEVGRQGWVEIYPQYDGDRLTFKLEIYAESGQQTDFGYVGAMEHRG